jgi:curved DNA-binding protein CbpA
MTPWDVLGIAPGSSQDDIKKAYRQKMRECHPDVNPHDPAATKKAQIVNKAFQMLMNPQPEPQPIVPRWGYVRVVIYGNSYSTGTSTYTTAGGYW